MVTEVAITRTGRRKKEKRVLNAMLELNNDIKECKAFRWTDKTYEVDEIKRETVRYRDCSEKQQNRSKQMSYTIAYPPSTLFLASVSKTGTVPAASRDQIKDVRWSVRSFQYCSAWWLTRQRLAKHEAAADRRTASFAAETLIEKLFSEYYFQLQMLLLHISVQR